MLINATFSNILILYDKFINYNHGSKILYIMPCLFRATKDQKKKLFMNKILLFALFIVLPFNALFPQEIPVKFKSITSSDGLSSSNVWAIEQDDKGFIWIGTYDGLNVYNGYEVKTYRNQGDDENSLSHSLIFSLLYDSKNRLWAGTPFGVNLFNPEMDNFQRFEPVTGPESSNRSIDWLYEGKDGSIYAGTSTGLNYFDEASKNFKNYFLPDEIPAGIPVTAFLQDNDHNFWIGTERGLYYFMPSKDSVVHFEHNKEKTQSLSNNLVTNLFEDREGDIWIGTENGLDVFNRKIREIKPIKKDQETPRKNNYEAIRCIAEGPIGTIWFGTKEGGLSSFDKVKNTLTRFTRDNKNEYSILDNALKDILVDKKGGLWIATFRGVSFANFYQYQFDHLEHKEYDPHSLTDNYITSLFKDRKGQIWTGNRFGISLYNPENNQFVHFNHDPQDKKTIGDGAILNMTEDRTGNLWAVSHLGIINKFDIKEKTFKRYEPDGHEGLRPKSSYVLATNDGTVWVAYMNGVSVYNPANDTFTHYDAPDKMGSSQISYIFEDSDENLLLIGWGSIFSFDKSKKKFNKIPQLPAHIQPFGTTHIYEDKNQNLWIGTTYNGLLFLNLKTGEFKEFNKSTHFPEIYIRAILEDKDGNLWLSSNKGIFKFNPLSGEYKNYDKFDGIKSSDFSSRTAVIADNGEMYFGGSHGITVFHPEKILQNPYPPQIALTKFELFNKEVPIGEDSPLKRSITEAKKIDLNYKHSVLSFEFVALNFNATEKNQYAYRMEGFDEDWNYSGTRRHATYTNLPPGNTYTFRVKGSNNDGVWNEEGTSVQIYIKPPFWTTWWFKTALFFVFFIFLFIVYKLRTRQHHLHRRELEQKVKERTEEVEAQKEVLSDHAKSLQKANDDIKLKNKKIKKQANKLKVIDHLKSEFLANISHEFRTPLTLILVPLEEMIAASTAAPDNKEQLSIMNRNAKRLLQLINQLLDLSKLENGTIPIELSQKDIVAFLNSLKLSFQPLAHKHQIDYHFYSTEKVLYARFDSDQLEKIVYNLISNAFKFTEDGGSITVSATPIELTDPEHDIGKGNSSRFIRITVSDTGQGIPKEHLPHVFDRFYQAEPSLVRKSDGAGIGLALTKELVELHGGKIKVDSEPGQGTCFTVFLPLVQDENTEINQAMLSENTRRQPEVALEPYSEINESDNFGGTSNVPLLLIVEDNRDLRQQIRRIFHNQFRIEEAEDGAEGWKKASEKLPDLIISDVMMPGKDGFALCNQLKNDLSTSHIPTILLSARIDGEEKGLSIGADDYITKPFNAKTLVLKVRNLLETRQRFREQICRNLGLQNEAANKDSINNQDRVFIETATDIALKYLTDEKFEMEFFYKELGMSRTLVYKKIKSLTGLGPNEFIRQIRLNKASQLLREEKVSVSEAMFKVGFNHRSYFIKCFKAQFGHLPSEHAGQEGVDS